VRYEIFLNKKQKLRALVLLATCGLGGVTLFAAITATGLIRRIDVSQKQNPAGEHQIVFSVQATQVRFGAYGGTCKFYVELKDANGKSYFGSTKIHQTTWRDSGGYPVTYIFPVKIEGIAQPSVVAYAAELEIGGVFLHSYKQNVRDIAEWKEKCAAFEKLVFNHVTYENW
jgi:hypothetical protein